MSTRTARRANGTIAPKPKPAARKRAKSAAPVKTQKTLTVTLAHKANKVNSVQFKGKGIITGLYVRKSVLSLLDNGQKTVDLSFAPHEVEPVNSLRFAEQGKQQAIGSLYLMRPECKTLGITAKSNVKLRLQRNGKTGLKVTVSAA